MNALTFDVEEWFHVSSLKKECEGKWDALESRVAGQTRKVLGILDEYDVEATFFVLGCVAEKNPELVREVAEKGHEVGSHGFSHKPVCEQTPAEFEEDLAKSLDAIESACGVRPISFRAPNFSITRDCLWALDVLEKNGITIDSSIYPSRIVHAKNVDAPQGPYTLPNGLKEFPGPTTKILGARIPYGGGVFFRMQPYWFTKHAIEKTNENGEPAIIYIHPWELDPAHPKIACNMKARIIHYALLQQTEEKFRQLIKDFEFKPLKEIF
ncbi:MAG: XrtA system polysaccharide deacetylase [Candidatus Altiarchaeota archaeon]